MPFAGALLLAAQTAPAIPDAVTAAGHVADCVAATSGAGVDRSLIEGRGWTSMQIRRTDGKALPMAAYVRDGGMSFLSASTAAASRPLCVVLSPTNGLQRAEAIREALTSRFGVQPTGALTTRTIWIVDGHRIAATPIGDAASPSGLHVEVTLEKK